MNEKISISYTKNILEKAKQALSDAEYSYKDNRFYNANNRAYYSIFYCIKAVLSLEPIDFKRHKDAQGYFNKNYVKTNIFPQKLGHLISQASKIREDSDYDFKFVEDPETTKQQMETAKELIKYTEEYINDYINKNTI